MIEPRLHRPQAGRDVAEQLSEGKLCEDYAQELVETSGRACAMIAAMASDTLTELMLGNEIYQLQQDNTVDIRRPALHR